MSGNEIKTTCNAVSKQAELVNAMKRMDLGFSKVLKYCHLTHNSFRVLHAMYLHPEGAGLFEIADEVLLARPAVTVIIDGLVRDKLAIRSDSRQDHRRKIVKLSPRGLHCVRQVETICQQIDERLTQKLPGNLLSNMIEGLNIIASVMKESMDDIQKDNQKKLHPGAVI